MSTMNIAGLTPVEDPMYRYKMPRIQAKVEGRGNGIKTVLVNVAEVAASLNREAPEITKFFGCELGSQTTYTLERAVVNAAPTVRAVVNGAHAAADLQNHLCRYIENFVLCKSCKLPETHYKIKNGIISQNCLACGFKDSVDMTHKLTTFILAQHKKHKEAAAKDKKTKEGEAASKADKKSKKDKKEKGVEEDTSASEKKSSRKKSVSPGPEAEASSDAQTEVQVGAAAAELQDLDLAGDDEITATDDSIQRFKLFLKANPAASAEAVLEELRLIQTFASLRIQDRVIIYLGACFSDAMVAANEVSQHKTMLTLLAPSAILQRHLIAGFEWFCAVRFPSLLKAFPVALKQLFDEEVIDEEVFYEWATDMTRNEHSADPALISFEVLEQLRTAASPFITWLQEAEEEEEDDEGEGDEGEDV